MISHDDAVAAHADRVVHLRDGKLTSEPEPVAAPRAVAGLDGT